MAAYKQRYPNIPDVMVTDSDAQHKRQDQNLEFADEAEAYHKFKSHGYFTPHPAGSYSFCVACDKFFTGVVIVGAN